MDSNPIAAVTSAIARAQAQDSAQMALLRRALDLEAQNKLALVSAATAGAAANPPNLGNAVDTYA